VPIIAGKRLGPYEILSAVGAGGMGEVYRVRDTRLDRIVAIKVLPEAFAHDTERVSRFQREAKTLASLNHPNIATIHGLEQFDTTSYLVMELVPGETLQERIRRDGPVPVEEALSIAKQIAEALEAAHEKGVIHRDLKPANVKVTPDGKVKVLDFGLAKTFSGDTVESDPVNSPTLSMAATMHGVILGTAAYMSPEQARGKAVDKRTDIWAFGCVLYELLTGKKAFEGEDVTEILAAVVKTEPDWSRLPEATPSAIQVLLRRCLRKDRRQRLADAGGIRIEVEEALAAPASPAPMAAAPAVQGWRWQIWLGLATLGMFALGGAVAWYLKPALPSPLSPAHFLVALPPGDQLPPGNLPLVVSPDGTQLIYVGIRSGVRQLYRRALDDLEVKPISGTEGASNPFFSPDSQWIGFFADGKMKKISINGGAPTTLCAAGVGGGASWGADEMIVFAPGVDSGLWRVSAYGGQAQALTTPDNRKGEYSHRYPQILPGGKGVVYTALNGFGWDESRVELLRFDTKERTVLVRGGQTGRYVSSGHLIYYRAGSLLAIPFDLARLQIAAAAPIAVVAGVRLSTGTAGAAYSVSATGTLAYISAGPGQFESQLVWVNRHGEIQPLPAPPRAYSSLALSRDGKQVAVSITSDTEQLWAYDLSRGTLTKFASEQGSRRDSLWTPDGKRLVYRSNKAGLWNLFWRPSDGSGSEEQLITGDKQHAPVPVSFSPDGQLLAFTEISPTTGSDIWVLRLSDHAAWPFLQTPFDEQEPRFSPDGRWLAYVSNESGGYEVYVRPYPGPGGKWQVSSGGGGTFWWNLNGRELFYKSGPKMMAVDITTSPSFAAGKPKLLFEMSNFLGGGLDVSPDGQRFLMVKASEQAGSAPTQINVVLNWFEELKRRVPTAK
jgi:eukaryotic-like serine/threonine-protein kinase